MLDNIGQMVLVVSLLSAIYGLDAKFTIAYMIPGTALGVLFGDLAFTWMAFRLARKTGRNSITAMPLGIDTPSTFGMVFFVIGPAYKYAQSSLDMTADLAAHYAWQIGICSLVISGLFKLVCAVGSGWIRRVIPRAGLLGSLAAIALVLISFLPLSEIVSMPVVGFVALAVILTTLVARVPVPGRIPGALAALIIGCILFYLMRWTGLLHAPAEPAIEQVWLPGGWLSVFRFEWIGVLSDSLQYLPVVIPFALATVVGGIDCTESAAAAGDEFDTRSVIGVEALATLFAGLCGGVIQTTPYIGHPAYKAMGGRAAYTLATALFIGGAGVIGYFSVLYQIIPKAAVFPILIFIGLEITSQSFHATPRRHYPAVVFACIPALAYLVMIFADQLVFDLAAYAAENPHSPLPHQLQTIRMVSNGFIVTSLLWASGLAAIIDRRLFRSAVFFATAGVLAAFGVIHSPFRGAPLVLPWQEFPSLTEGQQPFDIAAAYLAVALLLLAWGWWGRGKWEKIETDEQFDSLGEH